MFGQSKPASRQPVLRLMTISAVGVTLILGRDMLHRGMFSSFSSWPPRYWLEFIWNHGVMIVVESIFYLKIY